MNKTIRTLSIGLTSVITLAGVAAGPANAATSISAPPATTICYTGPCAADPNPGVITNIQVLKETSGYYTGKPKVRLTTPAYAGTSDLKSLDVSFVMHCQTLIPGMTNGYWGQSQMEQAVSPGAIKRNNTEDWYFIGAPGYTSGCTWQVIAHATNWQGYTSSVTTTGVMN